MSDSTPQSFVEGFATVKLSRNMAPGYVHGTEELFEAIKAVSVTLENTARQQFSKSGIVGKIWKFIKTLWSSRKDLIRGVDGFEMIPKEIMDLNGDELHKFADYLWDTYSAKLSAKGKILFEEALGFMVDETKRFRRIQNTLRPPDAVVLPD